MREASISVKYETPNLVGTISTHPPDPPRPFPTTVHLPQLLHALLQMA